MSATTYGTSGATYGLTAETGGLIQSLSYEQGTDVEETRNHEGEISRVTYYNPITSGDCEFVPTAASGINAVAVAAALTLTNTVGGSGNTYLESIATNRTNTTDMRRTLRFRRFPLIT